MSDVTLLASEPPTELGRYRVLSSTAGIRVSPLQLGGMSIGDAWNGIMGTMSKPQSFKLLDAYFDAGGNFIDTANIYQNEQSEIWIEERVVQRNNRDQITPNQGGNHRRSIHMSLRHSLKKLQTDYVDIFYLHWWDYTTSIKEIMDTLHHLVEQGKVLYLGISDTPAWIVSAANENAMATGKTPFSVYQDAWNVLMRDFEREIIPMARRYGMALAPWNVLGSGKFQTRKAMEERMSSGEGVRPLVKTRSHTGRTEDEEKISDALANVAHEHGIESVTAIALAYVMSKTPNVFPLVGGRKVEHLQDNIKALSIKLTDEQIKYLESVKPFDLGWPNNFISADPNVTGKSDRMARSSACFSATFVPDVKNGK
ncbi:putative aryl-alcohol dehydrogenase [Rhizodiscina lignyota]|uniref:Aryl-alcohol dehydrogenase n=1 Tax=Rhizodiscina lignyota TaxID=1504668 RepID=A0A9P4MEC6_9PEZI|nr:putative aryl-alcohol dehydrogenase [Rhizodiscina lignyota]